MTIRMTNKARQAAKTLAIAYCAYEVYTDKFFTDECNEEVARSRKYWAMRLGEVQIETGVTIVKPAVLLASQRQAENFLAGKPYWTGAADEVNA